jgi:hypothetical protein
MEKEKTSEKWLEMGYDLFAHEGPDGIHVERIARILNLNKSSFYHFFGTMEIFYEHLMVHHYNAMQLALDECKSAQTFDPEYLNTAIKHKVAFMAQVQLNQHKSNPVFTQAHQKINQKIDQSIGEIWNKYQTVAYKGHPYLLYLGFVRDAFYARVTFANFNYNFLRALLTEAKAIVHEIQFGKTFLNRSVVVGRVPGDRDDAVPIGSRLHK